MDPEASSVAQASLSAAEQTAIGGASGVLEVFLQQPMVAVKNALQAGRPLPTALGVYYRGTAVNAASIAPITAIQFGFSQGLSDALYGDKPPGTLGLLGTSGAAGAVSGFVSGPAEMVMIQQQVSGRTLAGELGHIVRTAPAALSRGLGLAMGRDGLFTCGYLGLAPILQEGLKPTLGDGSSFLVGGVAAGVIGAGVTHPLDTLKTVVQTRALDPDAKAQGQYMREIFQREGVAGFYSGFLPRAARTCGAVFILNASKSFLEGAWLDHKQRKM